MPVSSKDIFKERSGQNSCLSNGASRALGKHSPMKLVEFLAVWEGEGLKIKRSKNTKLKNKTQSIEYATAVHFTFFTGLGTWISRSYLKHSVGFIRGERLFAHKGRRQLIIRCPKHEAKNGRRGKW